MPVFQSRNRPRFSRHQIANFPSTSSNHHRFNHDCHQRPYQKVLRGKCLRQRRGHAPVPDLPQARLCQVVLLLARLLQAFLGTSCSQMSPSAPAAVARCVLSRLGSLRLTFCPSPPDTALQSDHKQVHKSSARKKPSFLQSIQDAFGSPTPLPLHAESGAHDPFPGFPYTGPLRPYYPLSARRKLPESIVRPDYSEDGIPRSEYAAGSSLRKISILNKEEIEGMRKVCRLAREVLDIGGAAVRPGITTDEIDEIIHKACIERDVSPFRWRLFSSQS